MSSPAKPRLPSPLRRTPTAAFSAIVDVHTQLVGPKLTFARRNRVTMKANFFTARDTTVLLPHHRKAPVLTGGRYSQFITFFIQIHNDSITPPVPHKIRPKIDLKIAPIHRFIAQLISIISQKFQLSEIYFR